MSVQLPHFEPSNVPVPLFTEVVVVALARFLELVMAWHWHTVVAEVGWHWHRGGREREFEVAVCRCYIQKIC